MLKKTNIAEIYKTIAEGKVEITDNTICGKCVKCFRKEKKWQKIKNIFG